ncbi:MAG: hypothetical protein ACRD6W_02750, partial [Nitrososphaerales archaeon]
QPAPCAREVRRRLRARAPASAAQQGEGVPIPNGNQLLLAEAQPSRKDRSVRGLDLPRAGGSPPGTSADCSSANV